MIVMDVDGVLTDGKLYVGADGCELKAFNTKDGMGINLAMIADIQCAVISGRHSPAVVKRAKELNIDYVYQGIVNKKEILYSIIADCGIDLQDICYIGDDINDLPALKVVGLSVAPKDASESVRRQVEFVTEANGGEGVVREVVDYIMKSSFEYDNVIKKYFDMEKDVF
jgi:3-deoxy-D-manno-octulosonate 8-phosphate phosphatase (KDO 8-P phosphatase)